MKELTPATKKYVKTQLKPRPFDSQKGDNGKILIIAGSFGMAGAAVMTGKAALRAGAGLTTYLVPDEIVQVLQIAVPEAMCRSRNRALEDLSGLDFGGFDAVAFGPGLGQSTENQALLERVLSHFEGVLVLDADGLNTLVKLGVESLKDAACQVIITPHMGEAARLLGKSIAELSEDREAAVSMLYEKTGAISVLKGAGTLITDGKTILKNTTGTPGMAKGGSGDVLTGIITALAGQGLTPFDAAGAGVFIHGYAGELAEKNHGQYGMLPTDTIDEIGHAMREITGR